MASNTNMVMTKKSILSVILSPLDFDKEKFCCGKLDLPFPAEDIGISYSVFGALLILLKIMPPIEIMPYWKWFGKSQPCLTLTLTLTFRWSLNHEKFNLNWEVIISFINGYFKLEGYDQVLLQSFVS